MSGKRRYIGRLGLDIPRSVGRVSGWWFSWQAQPWLLVPDGERVLRKSAYRVPTSKKKLMNRVKAAHISRHGHWCPGVPELAHEPHEVQNSRRHYLTVDHIVPVIAGGLTVHSNLRVICAWSNRALGRRALSEWSGE